MGKIANRQSLAILDRGLKSQPFSQFCCIRVFKTNRQSRVSNRNFKSEERQRFESRVFFIASDSRFGSRDFAHLSGPPEIPQGSVNGGFQTVVRVWSGEQIPAPHLNLNLTSVLPQIYLCLTSFLPQFNLFCLLPCDTSQEPNGNCSDELFYFGCFVFVFSGGFSFSEFSSEKESFKRPTHQGPFCEESWKSRLNFSSESVFCQDSCA